jgi:protein TonB
LSTYRLSAPYERPPMRRRLSGFALALAINLGLLLVLLGLGVIQAPEQEPSRALVVDLLPESHSVSATRVAEAQRPRPDRQRPVPKPPPIVLPVKPTITPPPRSAEKSQPWVEMSKEDMAAADVSKLASTGVGSGGDSEAVGQGPHGETLYAAEWAREPSGAELRGYLPPDPPDGYGIIACKTIPGNRVEDCVALDQYPRGSHLAAAVLNAAWQFRVRPRARTAASWSANGSASASITPSAERATARTQAAPPALHGRACREALRQGV